MEASLAKLEADRMLELLIKHQPGLIANKGREEADAEGIAQFIDLLRAALVRHALKRD